MTKKRGFAAMDPELQREIASMGGKRAHELGRAHQFTPESGRAAGRKAKGHRRTSEEAREAGKKDGEASRRG